MDETTVALGITSSDVTVGTTEKVSEPLVADVGPGPVARELELEVSAVAEDVGVALTSVARGLWVETVSVATDADVEAISVVEEVNSGVAVVEVAIEPDAKVGTML